MIEDDTSTLKFVSAGPIPWLSIFLGMVLFGAGIFLIIIDNKAGWPIAIFSSLLIPALLLYKSKNTSTLIIAFGGFSISHAGHTSSFIWSDIEKFIVSGDRSKKYVTFVLSSSGKKRCPSRNIFFSTAESGGVAPGTRLPDHYGLGAEKLRALLSEWQMRGLKQMAPV